MMVIAIAAADKRKVASIDITGAYLECEIAEDDEVIMMLDHTLATLFEQIADNYVPSDYDGCLFN
jgi:hypothetical protein